MVCNRICIIHNMIITKFDIGDKQWLYTDSLVFRTPIYRILWWNLFDSFWVTFGCSIIIIVICHFAHTKRTRKRKDEKIKNQPRLKIVLKNNQRNGFFLCSFWSVSNIHFDRLAGGTSMSGKITFYSYIFSCTWRHWVIYYILLRHIENTPYLR